MFKRSLSIKGKMLLSMMLIFVIVVGGLVGLYIHLNNKYLQKELDGLSGGTISLDHVKEIRIKSYKIIFTLLIVSTVLVGAMSSFLIKKLSKEVEELQDNMYIAGKGDLTTRCNVETIDEIGDLKSSFNVMVAKQTDIVNGLKQTVRILSETSEDMAAISAEVTSAVEEIASNMEAVSEDSQVGNEATLEVSQVLLELSSLIQMSKKLALSTEENSNIALNAAIEGKETIEKAMESMKIIEEKSCDVENLVQNFTKHLEEITNVSSTINGLADQTNLLALNASIEAARAGELGKGFAVVADEIRKLAEQSNKEANEVANLVNKIEEITSLLITASNESKEKVKEGTYVAEKGVESLDNIMGTVGNTVDNIKEIVEVTENEVASSDKIIDLINHVATSIENAISHVAEVAASTEEITASMENVNEATIETSQIAFDIEKMVGDIKTKDTSDLNDIEILETAKTDHLMWKLKVENMIKGMETLDLDDVVSHTACRLGQWYFQENNPFKDEKAYIELNHPHKMVHESAINAVEAYNSGNLKKSRKYLKDLQYYSGIVINELNKLMES